MNAILIIAVVVAAGFVLFALARGLFHFAQGHKAAVDGTEMDNHLKQNAAMFSRVKWQAVTIILLVIIGAVAGVK